MALKQKLAELFVEITAKLAPLKAGLAKARGVMKRGLDKMVRMARRAAIGIGVALVAAFAWATKAAMVQEDAERELAAALRETGDATKENIDGLKKYASELQEVTIFGDEAILSQMAYAKNLGVSTNQLKDAAKAAIGLAAKYKLELATAMMLVGRASQGQTQMLTRYGIVLDDTLSDQEKFNAVLKIGADAFGLAEDAAKGTRGVLKQLWNVIGDVAEKIAEPLLPKIIEVAKALARWLKNNQKLIASKFGKWVDATAAVLTHLVRPLKWLSEHTLIATILLTSLITVPIVAFFRILAGTVSFLVFGLLRLGNSLAGLIVLLFFLDRIGRRSFKWEFYGTWFARFNRAQLRMAAVVHTAQFALWKLVRTLQGIPAALATFGRAIKWSVLHPLQSVVLLLNVLRVAMVKTQLVALTGIAKVGGAISGLVIAIKGITIAGLAVAAGFVAVLAGIAAGIAFIVWQVLAWGKALYGLVKYWVMLKKQRTFEERAAEARTTRKERELIAEKKLAALEQKRLDIIKDRAKVKTDAADEAAKDKERLEAQLEFLEKIGSKHRDIAKLKRILLALEAKEVAEKTGGDPRAIRLGLTRKALALQAAADKTAADERRTEYRDRLQTLKTLFMGEARYAKELSIIKKRLRHEEALDIQRAAPWLDLDAIKKMLKAKDAPVEIARAGLVGLQAAWGQVATGTQRTQEEQLRALVRIAESVERQEDIAEGGRGIQGMNTPRY